jgi:hypothetical protein
LVELLSGTGKEEPNMGVRLTKIFDSALRAAWMAEVRG